MGILLGTFSGTAEAEPTYGSFNVTLDSQPFTLEAPFYLIEGVPMAPLGHFATKFGIATNWYPESEEITLYRSNNYMRYKIGSTHAAHNGYSLTLALAPVTIDKTIYVPLEQLSKAFSFNYKYNLETLSAELITRDTRRYYYSDDIFLETNPIPNFKYTMALPYGWTLLGENLYGIKDEYEDYNLRLGTLSLDSVQAQDVYGYRDLLRTNLIAQYGEQMLILEESTTTINALPIVHLSYQLTLPEGERAFITYLTEYKGNVYTFDGSYAPTADPLYMKTLYKAIISTLSFPDLTVQREHEHYIEYSPFISLGVQLTTPLTSNIEVYETLPLVGHLVHHQKIKQLYALVTKDNQSLKLEIPIQEDGTINTILHTPFAAGKHNFELIAKPMDDSAEQVLLHFSALNISNRPTRYRIPTKYIQSSKIEVNSLATILTSEKTSSYFKAKALYEWLINNVEPEFGLPRRTLKIDQNPPRTLPEIIIEEKATPLEYNLLLAGLLRTLDYEAKVLSGQKNGQLSFFVETYINGKWVIMDPVSAILAREYPHLADYTPDSIPTPVNQYDTYNYLPKLEYLALFDAYTEVE